MINNKVKICLSLVSVSFVLLLLFIWARSVSYIVIAFEDESAGSITVIEGIDNEAQIEIPNTRTTEKVRVRSGVYSVRVFDKNLLESNVHSVQTEGFFKESSVAISFSGENERSFVGSSPASCTYYTGETLLSWSCDSSLGAINVHIPSTEKRPTYTRKIDSGIKSNVYMFELQGKNYIAGLADGNIIIKEFKDSGYAFTDVAKFKPDEEGRFAFYSSDSHLFIVRLDVQEIYRVDSSFNSERLPSLETKGNELFSASAAGTELTLITKPIQNYQHPNKIGSVLGDSIRLSEEEVDEGEVVSEAVRTPSVLSVLKDGSWDSSDTDGDVFQYLGCGDKFCYLSDGLYGHSKELGSKNEHKLANSQKVLFINSSVYILDAYGVLKMSDSSNEGYYVYTFGDSLSGCGVFNSKDAILVCIDGSLGRQVIVIGSSPARDYIDRKLIEISKNPLIENITPFGNIIFYSPSLKEYEFVPSLGSYAFSPNEVRSTNSNIKKQFNEQGLDTTYTIISTYNY